ncbi:MAG: NACHT domain-containing protein, partial [bacterium]
MYLFLDSLDECQLAIPRAAKIILTKLFEFKDHTERLSLRCSCRSANWPIFLEDGLIELWGEKNFGVYEVFPLTREDIIEAAESNKIAPTQFLDALKRKEVQPFALNPITLRMLIDTFESTKGFSDTKQEIYKKGCELLCMENNLERRAARATGNLSVAKRMAIASRIAAVMIFCNKSSICLDENLPASDSDLTFASLQEGGETLGYDKFRFSERDLKEVVCETGLFTLRSNGRVGFAHSDYAAYLAARYIMMHNLSIQQIKALIQVTTVSEQKTIPQLKGVAGWLNTLNKDLLKETIQVDPKVLLSSEIEVMEYELRRELVQSLLNLFERQEILDNDWGLHVQYSRLSHPEIDKQIEPYISDKQKHWLVRRVAIDIVEACNLVQFQDLLANVTLDKEDNIHIRDEAAHAVVRIGDDKTKLLLKPLALEPNEDDERDQLKGSALRALWPKHITANELFNSLTLPKRESFFGAYWGFTKFSLLPHLKIEDLPTALNWVKQHPASGLSLSIFSDLTEGILIESWKNIERSEIRNAFADAAIERIRNHLSILPLDDKDVSKNKNLYSLNEKVRKSLIQTLLSKIEDFEGLGYSLIYDEPKLITEEDLDWLIDQLGSENNRNRIHGWVMLIWYIFRNDREDHIKSVYNAMQKCKPLFERFSMIFGPVELNSTEAEEMKTRHERNKKWEEESRQRQTQRNEPISPPPSSRIEKCLNRFEAGDYDAWWQLCLEMTLEATTKYYYDELKADLTALPGWKNSTEQTRKRILEAAKKYVLERDAKPENWLGTDKLHRPAMAGYKAFILLKKERPDVLTNFDTSVWKNWAPILLGHPEPSGVAGQDETYLVVIQKAYQQAPQEIISTLLILIDKENNKYDSLFIVRKMEHCWDDQLSKVLLDKVKDNSLKPSSFQDLLSDLIKHKSPQANEYAKSLLRTPIPTEHSDREKTVGSALALLTYAEDAGWDAIWPAIQNDKQFGLEVFLALPDNFEERRTISLADRIGEDATAELFIWLSKLFPRDEDPDIEEVHTVSARESIADYRDALLRQLANKGNEKAVAAIEHIKRELPELDYVNIVLISAKETLREKTWNPISTEDFLKLTRNPDARLILSADHLSEMVLESLKRLQDKLQG